MDGIERLATYIYWLVKKNPTVATSLFEAKNTLVQKDFIFKTVEHITDDEFATMVISSWIKAFKDTDQVIQESEVYETGLDIGLM